MIAQTIKTAAKIPRHILSLGVLAPITRPGGDRPVLSPSSKDDHRIQPHTIATSYRRIGSTISGASFANFGIWGAILRAIGRANFWPPPPRRKRCGIALATRYCKARQIVASPWPFADAVFLRRDMVDGSGHSAIQGASVLATRKP